MDIYTLREIILTGRYLVSRHADQERVREGYTVGDLVSCVLSGEIVREDVDTDRGTEYLIQGWMWTKEQLRVKIGIGDDQEATFITVYPRDDRRTGRRKAGRR